MSALDDTTFIRHTDRISYVFGMENRICSILIPIFIQFYGGHYLTAVIVYFIMWKCCMFMSVKIKNIVKKIIGRLYCVYTDCERITVWYCEFCGYFFVFCV